MLLSDFSYDLPEELIAQVPASPRDSARLLVAPRSGSVPEHRIFRELPELLLPGDVLVFNDTKVIPARLHTEEGREVLLLRESTPGVWRCLVRGGKAFTVGSRHKFAEDLSGEVVAILASGEREIRFASSDFWKELHRAGSLPLPPYIHSEGHEEEYQTVYAKVSGSAAAPTAGLHFTEELLARLEEKGIQREFVTLHVGLGTFQPVKVDDIADHVMHSEWFTLAPEVAERLNAARREGRRIVGVGTTACRVLESAADESRSFTARSGDTAIFIYPGYRFRGIDALITNFHLPRSTLLMLVSALLGRDRALQMYQLAVSERYRFFSFGDAMLIA